MSFECTKEVEVDIFKQRRRILSAALRSGKYKQGQNRLCIIKDNETKHCCLGVACEVYNENVPLEERVEIQQKIDDFNEYISVLYDGNDITLPKKVAEWYNITTTGKLSQHVHLTGMNDSGLNFIYIADIFESDLLQPRPEENK